MMIPTEPIGSIPRPPALIAAANQDTAAGPQLDAMYDAAVRDTICRFEATGSPVVTDGEQRKYHNFLTYCVHGAPNTSPDGFQIPHTTGNARMPRLTAAPFRYQRYADEFLAQALRYASVPVKQAVISPSALSLMYPPDGIAGYPREAFITDLLDEHTTEVRRCLDGGAYRVQIDFTEGHLAMKLDPSGELLNSFIDLNNLALSRFTAAEQALIGVHTCPGGERAAAGSTDVDYAELLPSLFELTVGSFYIALAGEPDRARVLDIIARHVRPGQRVFVGVINTSSERIESPAEVCERVLEAARSIPADQLGTTDDCGFAPFCDDQSNTRDGAFAKIRARVDGTALASAIIGGRA